MSSLLRRFLPKRPEDVSEQYQRHGYHLFRSAFPQEQVSALADSLHETER